MTLVFFCVFIILDFKVNNKARSGEPFYANRENYSIASGLS